MATTSSSSSAVFFQTSHGKSKRGRGGEKEGGFPSLSPFSFPLPRSQWAEIRFLALPPFSSSFLFLPLNHRRARGRSNAVAFHRWTRGSTNLSKFSFAAVLEFMLKKEVLYCSTMTSPSTLFHRVNTERRRRPLLPLSPSFWCQLRFRQILSRKKIERRKYPFFRQVHFYFRDYLPLLQQPPTPPQPSIFKASPWGKRGGGEGQFANLKLSF